METTGTIEDYSFSAEETEELTYNPPKEESFPMLIIMVAIFKDMIDLGSFGLLGIITSPIFIMILFFWRFGKSNYIRRKLTKWILRRYIAAFVIGIIPGLNILPEATILVLLIHYREKKVVQEFYKALEVLHKVV